jgi:E3 ubiquitin-protein ligase HUWE1
VPATPQQTIPEKVVLSQAPVIPAPVLRLVVNILTAGECSGRAFSHTLSLIQHLSFIPAARDVIAQELCSRAQEFGHHLYNALDDLATALRDSRNDDVTIAIASKFSPASSDQAKLLRVLKTIDYMYSPKSVAASADTADKDVEKVQTIYEGFRFTALWRRLGDCLAIIEEKQELEHIATVLLPLIESLMVVCKYVGPRTASNAVVRNLRASSSPRTPTTPRESMEDLFVTFTDMHRKVLNLMVRNNPSLMSGSFSLLVNNARVLDFDNKRNYFNQQLHRRPASREHYSTLQLNVRRNRVFEDSFQYLQRKTGEQIKHGKLSVRFLNEEGVDAGGVTREWFQILARQMFNPDYCLFQPCAADRLTYQPNKASSINPEHLSFFKFVGRIIGKAIYDGRLLDAYFARSLYRQILGKPVDYRDVEWIDPEYYKSLCWILENDPSLLELTFSVEADEVRKI